MGVEPRHVATPTQEAFPWHTVARTIVQAVFGLIVLWPMIIEQVDGAAAIPWVAASLTVTATITRIMALPGVNAWLTKYLPVLAPEAKN